MTNKTSNAMRYALLLVTLGLFVGCGDYPVDSSAESVDVEPRSRSIELLGRTVYLRRRSTLCGSLVSNPLVAQVGAGVEFTSDQTRELELPCSGASSPAVEVRVDGRSLIFDFSNVDREGVFPEAQFEGYELAFARRCGDMVLAGVSIDKEHSTMAAAEIRTSHHYDRVGVDLQGLAYDHSSFIKIDLELVDVECLEDALGMRG
jgi:hypothetical protein